MRRSVRKRRQQRRLLRAHQTTPRCVFNARDRLTFATQKSSVVRNSGAPFQQMTVVVCQTLGNPKPARSQRASEGPWPKLQRPQTFDIPDVKNFMRDGVERAGVHTFLAERPGLDYLRRSQMLHAVAGVIVGGEVYKEGVGIKFGRTPHS